jgi:hypothetical protein
MPGGVFHAKKSIDRLRERSGVDFQIRDIRRGPCAAAGTVVGRVASAEACGCHKAIDVGMIVGELAQAGEVSRDTLRLYERERLLPAPSEARR